MMNPQRHQQHDCLPTRPASKDTLLGQVLRYGMPIGDVKSACLIVCDINGPNYRSNWMAVTLRSHQSGLWSISSCCSDQCLLLVWWPQNLSQASGHHLSSKSNNPQRLASAGWLLADLTGLLIKCVTGWAFTHQGQAYRYRTKGLGPGSRQYSYLITSNAGAPSAWASDFVNHRLLDACMLSQQPRADQI